MPRKALPAQPGSLIDDPAKLEVLLQKIKFDRPLTDEQTEALVRLQDMGYVTRTGELTFTGETKLKMFSGKGGIIHDEALRGLEPEPESLSLRPQRFRGMPSREVQVGSVSGSMQRHDQGSREFQKWDETTCARIIDILIKATRERKIIWFRDADYFAVTFVPMLAVSFRLAGRTPATMGSFGREQYGNKTQKGAAQHMTVAFMDNKELQLLAAQYPNLHDLTGLVHGSFRDDYRRDTNERLVWLEKALNTFLPHVIVQEDD